MDKIQINIERGEAGLFYATSQQIKGLLVVGHSLQECLEQIPKVYSDLETFRIKNKAI